MGHTEVADLVDQAFTWLRDPVHTSLAAVVLAIPTLLWRLLVHGTIHDRSPLRNGTENLVDADSGSGDDGSGDGGTE